MADRMVERVARWLCAAAGNDPEGPLVGSEQYVSRLDDSQSHPAWEAYQQQAKRLIDEMREPSAAMCATVSKSIGEPDGVCSTIWRLMIDAALAGD